MVGRQIIALFLDIFVKYLRPYFQYNNNVLMYHINM